MLKNIGLFCKRDLQKRPIFCKETYIFKHPTHCSHPITASNVLSLYNTLQRTAINHNIAAYCNLLQLTATPCNTQANTAEAAVTALNVLSLYNTLQRTALNHNIAAYCNLLQLTAKHCNTQANTAEAAVTALNVLTHQHLASWLAMEEVVVCCSVLQCVAVCCNMLQCVAVCCCVLQCVAVCCSVLQCVAVCYSAKNTSPPSWLWRKW